MRGLLLLVVPAIVLPVAVAMATSVVAPDFRFQQVLSIDDALDVKTAQLAVHADDLDAYACLGDIHMLAYALNVDAVVTDRLPQGNKAFSFLHNFGVLPITRSSRLESVSKERISHLAEAIRAYQKAIELCTARSKAPPVAADNQTTQGRSFNKYSPYGSQALFLRLGNALWEARDRFITNPWPFNDTNFDIDAKTNCGKKEFWSRASIDSLRHSIDIQTLGLVPRYGGFAGSGAEGEAARLILEVSREGGAGSLTPEEIENLRPIAASSEWSLKGIRLNPSQLPPQPAVLQSIYPLTVPGLYTANLYARAVDAMLFVGSPYQELPMMREDVLGQKGNTLDSQELVRAKELFGFNKTTLQLIREASGAKECRYPIDLTEGIDLKLPHLSQLKSLSNLLLLQVRYSGQTKDATTAVESLQDLVAVANSLAHEPVMISQIVRAGILRSAVAMFEELLSKSELTDDDLARMQMVLASGESNDSLKFALTGEKTAARAAKNDPNAAAFASPESVEVMERLEKATEEPLPEFLNTARQIQDDSSTQSDQPQPGLGMFAGVAGFTRATALLRTAIAASAIERYWHVHGSPPAKLDDIYPGFINVVVEDPYDGQPLRYRSGAKGFVVYSVGDNRVDDKGDDSGRPPLDCVFEVGVLD